MPISSIAISVEGVLSHPFSTAPLPTGVALYHTLKDNFNILLYSEQDKKALDHWLSIEALNIHAAVEYNDSAMRQNLDDYDRKLTQIRSLRRRGYSIELVIEPDPKASAWMVVNGFNVLTFTHAQYAMPKWRPDYSDNPKPWDMLVEAENKSAELKALDSRLKKLDETSEWE
jgi:hypothetical protein